MTDSRLHVLFLAAWYPHRYDAMAGLFVRKHALAVSEYVQVTVLYLHEDNNINQTEIIEQQTESVREIYVYYPESRLFPHLTYRKAFSQGWHYVSDKYGKPDLTHVNVLGKQGLSAYWLYKKYNIPYVITEHWTGYLSINFRYKGLMRKLTTELIARNAKCIMPVSENLSKRMQQLGLKGNYQVVYNVVDDFFYNQAPTANRQSSGFNRFLHVSCFDDEAKNVSGLLEAAALLYRQRKDFSLTLVGTGKDINQCRQLAERINISNICTFTEELTPEEVADQMRQHDFLVMFSNYENAPVVISEALAAGMPIITTNVGGIPEMVSSSEGILINARDKEALVKAMNTMCDSHQQFDKKEIRQKGLLYCFKTVGRQLNEIYTSAIG